LSCRRERAVIENGRWFNRALKSSLHSYQRKMSEKKSACTGVFHSILLNFYQLSVTVQQSVAPGVKSASAFCAKSES
jgi:hypothetical protein